MSGDRPPDSLRRTPLFFGDYVPAEVGKRIKPASKAGLSCLQQASAPGRKVAVEDSKIHSNCGSFVLAADLGNFPPTSELEHIVYACTHRSHQGPS